MPEAAPRCSAGTLLMIEEVFGEANRPSPMPLQKMIGGKDRVREVDRQQHQPGEPGRGDQQPGRGERARAVAVGQTRPEIGPAIRNPAVSGSM